MKATANCMICPNFLVFVNTLKCNTNTQNTYRVRWVRLKQYMRWGFFMLDQYFVAIQVERSWELLKVRPPSPSYKLKSFKQVQQICSESNRIVFRELVCLFVLKKLPHTSNESNENPFHTFALHWSSRRFQPVSRSKSFPLETSPNILRNLATGLFPIRCFPVPSKGR